jgi:U3 small nucleolar RNA-associated protein 21
MIALLIASLFYPTGSLVKKASSLSIPLASLKFPPITSLSYSSARAKDWDDILTGHTDETVARSWTMQGKKVGKHTMALREEKGKGVVGSIKVLFYYTLSIP